jgi:hypothetical protein
MAGDRPLRASRGVFVSVSDMTIAALKTATGHDGWADAVEDARTRLDPRAVGRASISVTAGGLERNVPLIIE